jgi:putative salt-induced outer membrane protein YdiY
MTALPRHHVLFVALCCWQLWGQDMPTEPQKKIDVVVMKNGDRLSGEVKKIQNGMLYIEMPYVSEDIAVDWLQVVRIDSERYFRVELEDGQRLRGKVKLATPTGSGSPEMTILAVEQEVRATRNNVIGLGDQKENFFHQLKGNIDFGYSYTSGNTQVQGNFDAKTTFESEKYLIQGTLNSTISIVEGADETNRQQVTGFFGHYLSKKNLLFSAAEFLVSSQQQLDLRSTYAGGYGRSLIRTPRTELTVFSGVGYNHEQYDPSAGPQPSHNSVESLLAVRYSTFQFKRSQFVNSFQVIPSLSDAGRVRSNLNTTFSLKWIHDLHFQVSVWDTYDSRPPVAAKKNELGISTGFGWSY